MKLKFLTAEASRSLYKEVPNNLDRYREGGFLFLEDDPSQSFEVGVDADISRLADMEADSSPESEKKNCELVFTILSGITPYMGRDVRLWINLTHTCALSYTRRRWPIPDDDEEAVRYIRRHFFAQKGRGLERDNSISRLWWMAYICSRAEDLALSEALDAFLYRADVRANIIERPTSSQSVPVITALLSELSRSLKGDQELFERSRFRKVMKEINLFGGHILLESLAQKEIRKIIQAVP